MAETVDTPAAKQAAYRRVAQVLPVASRLYSVREYIERLPADHLVEEFMCCTLAADCWNARIACPRTRFQVGAWKTYLGTKVDAARSLLSAALARWAILECIPVRWIPQEHVRAQIQAIAARAKLEADVLEMQLIPPVSGGHEWVRLDCGRGLDDLFTLANQMPVAAILHWPNRTAAAIVTAVDGRLKAFGSAFGGDGFHFEPAELVGGVALLPAEVQRSGLSRYLHALGWHVFIWRSIRFWRLLRGVNPLAAI